MIEDNLVRCGSKELNDGKKKEKVEPSANNPLRERVPKEMSAIKGPNRAAPNISKRSEHDSQERRIGARGFQHLNSPRRRRGLVRARRMCHFANSDIANATSRRKIVPYQSCTWCWRFHLLGLR